MGLITDQGDELIEDCTPERRGERSYAPRQSGARRTFQLHAGDYTVDDARIYSAVKRLVGYNVMQSEVVGGTTRRWVAREMPDRMPNIDDEELNPNGDLGPRCSSTPRVYPMSSRAQNDASTGWPLQVSGVFIQAQYDTFPFFHAEDDQHLALAGPLAAGQPTTALARPDEGYFIQSVGWRSSRYISKDEQPASRTLTLPGGMVLYSDIYILANTAVKHGLPWAQYKSTIRYCWHCVPVAAIPQEAIAKTANRVNDATFDGYPAGTLLYLSTGIQRYQGPLYDWLCDISHTFAFMPNYDSINALAKYYGGWNSIPALVDTGLGVKRIRMAKVSADGNDPTGGNALFQPADFSYLFRPPNA